MSKKKWQLIPQRNAIWRVSSVRPVYVSFFLLSLLSIFRYFFFRALSLFPPIFRDLLFFPYLFLAFSPNLLSIVSLIDFLLSLFFNIFFILVSSSALSLIFPTICLLLLSPLPFFRIWFRNVVQKLKTTVLGFAKKNHVEKCERHKTWAH
jgi:hypothetical protein